MVKSAIDRGRSLAVNTQIRDRMAAYKEVVREYGEGIARLDWRLKQIKTVI